MNSDHSQTPLGTAPSPDALTAADARSPRTFGRRIDCSESADDKAEKRVRSPARSDGPRRDTLAGGRRSEPRGRRT